MSRPGRPRAPRQPRRRPGAWLRARPPPWPPRSPSPALPAQDGGGPPGRPPAARTAPGAPRAAPGAAPPPPPWPPCRRLQAHRPLGARTPSRVPDARAVPPAASPPGASQRRREAGRGLKGRARGWGSLGAVPAGAGTGPRVRSSLPNLPAGPDARTPSARTVISIGPALLAGLQPPPRALEEGWQPTPRPGGGRVPCSRQQPGPPGRAWRDQVRARPQPLPPPPGSPRHPGPREVDRPWTAGKIGRAHV